MEHPAWSRRGGNGHPGFRLRELYLRKFAERFMSLEDSGVLLLDAEFRIVAVSDYICQIFGARSADAHLVPADKWFEQLDVRPHPFDRTLLQGQSFRNRALDWGGAGSRRTVMMEGGLLMDDIGPIGAFVLFRDTSVMTNLEEQVRRSDRLKTIGQIAAGTAHEIRNPLTAIKGFMQLLQKSVTDRDMQREREYVNIVLSELERVNELVSEFLLLSKEKEVRLAPMKIGQVLQELLPVIRNEALLYDVIVHYEPEPDQPPVSADKELLKQVLLNLGKNAIEAMSGGGTLIFREFVRADRPGFVAIEIRDTGPGIPEDVRERIFDPFFTTKPQGTGLGLSICQRIVHDLGGMLEMESDAAGTSFAVWLPLTERASAD